MTNTEKQLRSKIVVDDVMRWVFWYVAIGYGVNKLFVTPQNHRN